MERRAGLTAQMEAAGMPPERITVDIVSELARATGRAQYWPTRRGWRTRAASSASVLSANLRRTREREWHGG